jgi:hypothetical protein
MSEGASVKDRRACHDCRQGEEAAKAAVHRVFAILGVNIDDPQQVAKFQESLRFTARLNSLADKGLTGAFLAVVTIAATGTCLLVWEKLTK